VRDVDHHAETVHLANDIFAERREAVVMFDLGIINVALRICPVVGVEVGEGHIANAEIVVVAEETEGIFDSMTAFDAHEGSDLVFVVGADYIVGRCSEDEIVGVSGDDVGTNGIYHLQGAIGRVIVFDVFGSYVDRKEFGAEEAFHAREIGLAAFVWSGDIVAGDCSGGDIVVRIDKDGFASDAVNLRLRDLMLLLGDEWKRERCDSRYSVDSLRVEQALAFLSDSKTLSLLIVESQPI
jgi:hypothetical protein